MKTSRLYILIFIQLLQARAELVFRRLEEGQSLGLSCRPLQHHSGPTGLHLYHRGARSQTTLLSVAEGGEVRVDPEHRARLQLRGGLDSLKVNVSLSHLQPSDAGLYTLELRYREQDGSERVCAQRTLLLVDGAGRSCRCSPRYPPLLLSIATAAALLLLTLSWLLADRCVKARRRHRPHPHAPIYEEMSRKQQQRPEGPQNNHEASAHLQEADFPVYANPNIRQPQDNYYACPRQLALTA